MKIENLRAMLKDLKRQRAIKSRAQATVENRIKKVELKIMAATVAALGIKRGRIFKVIPRGVGEVVTGKVRSVRFDGGRYGNAPEVFILTTEKGREVTRSFATDRFEFEPMKAARR